MRHATTSHSSTGTPTKNHQALMRLKGVERVQPQKVTTESQPLSSKPVKTCLLFLLLAATADNLNSSQPLFATCKIRAPTITLSMPTTPT